jgi:hypothetical protein
MTLARLLAAALLICALPALAQDRPNGGPLFCGVLYGASAEPAQPWGLFPNPPADLGSRRDPLDQIRLGQYQFSDKFDPHKKPGCSPRELKDRAFKIVVPDAQLPDDNTCLTMRSYVVARDSEDSDSTHLVSYTTCQPSARYRVKTTEMRVVTVDR